MTTHTHLDVDSAVPYLVRHGLVDPASIVDGDLIVSDSARRNRNLRVVSERGRSYLLKQAAPGEDHARATVAFEGFFYSACHGDDRAVELRRFLPGFVDYRQREGLLILEFLRDAQPLWAHLAGDDGAVRIEGVAELGAGLAVTHRLFAAPAWRSTTRLRGLTDAPPWILVVHKPGPDILERISPGNLKTIKILQKEPELSRHLDVLRKEWRPATLIHNDLKSDNVLVVDRDGHVETRLVDWELAQFGDPAWDVGGVLADLVGFWIASMPIAAGQPAEESLAKATHPLPNVQKAMRAFWTRYRKTAGLAADDAAAFLSRAVRYCAARLLQSAYEYSQTASTLSNHAVIMLQVAANVFRDPDGSLLDLYGIPMPVVPTGVRAARVPS